MKRRIVILLVALFIVGVAVIVWTLAGLPPVKYVLRYGISPGCEPTGETLEAEGVTFVEIGPGIFRMGSTSRAEGGDWLGKLCKPFGLPWGKQPEPSDEMPVHWVEFRRGFWIAATEITNAQYERFVHDHERNHYSKGDDHPVVNVTWEDAKKYCAWLTEKSGLPARLPSEAEWECACRAGSDGEFTFGDEVTRLSEHAWYEANSNGHPHQVATRKPNRWGLYDLHGNVREWCEDTYHGSYSGAPPDGSAWTQGGTPIRASMKKVPKLYHVLRGGSFFLPAVECRSAIRYSYLPEFSGRYLGFRPAFSNPDN